MAAVLSVVQVIIQSTNPTLRKYFKGYCQILLKVIKEAKRIE
jgi:hypothetical protein